jgi:tellurite methyltransferase
MKHEMTDWESRYRAGEHLRDEPHPLVIRFASPLTPGRALDVASGPGRHALWLANHGWNVTAVDSSPTAIELLEKRCVSDGISVRTFVADLEQREFAIENDGYDLIVVCNYLQRDLFPSIKAGIRPGGVVIAVIAMVDDDPEVKPMNPAFLLRPGELQEFFEGWELIHKFEGKPPSDRARRSTAELVARRPMEIR